MTDGDPGLLPTFLIVGAQRCGTTTLHALVKQHPQISMARPKELHFFDGHWKKGLDWYRDKFRPGPEHKQLGEATPIYMYDERSRRRMTETLPDVQLVVMLRNPTSRAYSQFWHSRERGHETLESFEEAVAAEPQRAEEMPMRTRRWFSYVDRGHFVDQLEALETAYGRERMHVILLEDLMADREGTLAALFDYLNVDPAAAAAIEPEWANKRGDAYPPMAPATKARLEEHFRPYNRRLADWLGRDLSHWG